MTILNRHSAVSEFRSAVVSDPPVDFQSSTSAVPTSCIFQSLHYNAYMEHSATTEHYQRTELHELFNSSSSQSRINGMLLKICSHTLLYAHYFLTLIFLMLHIFLLQNAYKIDFLDFWSMLFLIPTVIIKLANKYRSLPQSLRHSCNIFKTRQCSPQASVA